MSRRTLLGVVVVAVVVVVVAAAVVGGDGGSGNVESTLPRTDLISQMVIDFPGLKQRKPSLVSKTH